MHTTPSAPADEEAVAVIVDSISRTIPEENLNKIVNIGHEGRGLISFVKDVRLKLFYVIDYDMYILLNIS